MPNSWSITATEVANQMVTPTIAVPEEKYDYLQTVGYQEGSEDIPQAIQTYLDEHEESPKFLMVVEVEEVAPGSGAAVITVNSSESVLECINPSGTCNSAYIIYDSANNIVEAGEKSKGKDALV